MRTCLFCAGRVNSKEHAWPEWLLKLRWTDRRRGVIEATRTSGQRFLIEGPQPSIRVRHLCKTCNGGWMSDLEGDAKRVLLPMISNLSVPLDASDRHLIARWVTKTAMVFEFTREQPRSLFYSQEDRAALMTVGALPGETVVWLCKYNGSVWPGTVSTLLRTQSENPEVIGSVTTMTLRWLAIQLLTVKPVFSGSFALHTTPGRWEESTVLAFPTNVGVVHWPPPLGVGDADEPTILSLHRRFGSIVRPA